MPAGLLVEMRISQTARHRRPGRRLAGLGLGGNKGGDVGGDSPLLRLNDSAITRNTASKAGGGIYTDSGTITMQAGTVTNNTATDTGGGLFNTDDGDVTISASSAIVENDPNDCIGTDACDA